MTSGTNDPRILRILDAHCGVLKPSDVHRIGSAIEAGASAVRATYLEGISWSISDLASRCESPLELFFGVHLLTAHDGYTDPPIGYRRDLIFRDSDRHIATIFAPQVEVGQYRADFAFLCRPVHDQPPRMLVVELDGHEFHERTKAQAARDRSRDRWMHLQKIQVMRFTGSEVYADPIGCMNQVTEALTNLFHETDVLGSRRK